MVNGGPGKNGTPAPDDHWIVDVAPSQYGCSATREIPYTFHPERMGSRANWSSDSVHRQRSVRHPDGVAICHKPTRSGRNPAHKRWSRASHASVPASLHTSSGQKTSRSSTR